MKKKQTLEDILNDPKMNERLKERLYSKKGLLGKESPFSEILQQMVNTMLEGEIEDFLSEERASGNVNKGAKTALSAFEATWGKKYRYIVKQWTENRLELMAFLDFPLPMRRMIYTTHPVEALHRIMRKLVKSKAA